MLTLEDINNQAYFLWRKSQVKAMKTERLGKIHVSDLIKPCMRYVIYKKITPETGMSTEDMKSLYFGQLVHSNSQLADKEHHEKFLGYDFVEDKPVDLKWAQSLKEDDPKDQINAYAALLKKCYGIEAKRGCVIYISNSVSKEDRDKPTPLSFKLQDPDETLKELVEKAKTLKDALTKKTLPERTKNFLCDGMCPHATYCFEDNRKKYE